MNTSLPHKQRISHKDKHVKPRWNVHDVYLIGSLWVCLKTD